MNDLEKFYQNNTDKNLNKWKHYFDIYEENFSKYRGKKITVLEIGVFRGGSLKMWQNYFGEQINLIGIDIDPSCKKFEEKNIKNYIGNQTDEKFLLSVLNDNEKPEIIIDDGGHTSNQQQVLIFYMNILRIMEYTNKIHTLLIQVIFKIEMMLTFTEYAKALSDELNDWYRVKHYKSYKKKIDNVDVSYWAKNIFKISFYNSIIAISKKESEIPISMIK